MNRRMIGEVITVVIDEIGECTFTRDPMFPQVIDMSKKETAARAFAAVVELIDLCSTLVPTSRAQSYLQSALELTLANYDFLLERFVDQVEFSDSINEAAGTGWQSELNPNVSPKP